MLTKKQTLWKYYKASNKVKVSTILCNGTVCEVVERNEPTYFNSKFSQCLWHQIQNRKHGEMLLIKEPAALLQEEQQLSKRRPNRRKHKDLHHEPGARRATMWEPETREETYNTWRIETLRFEICASLRFFLTLLLSFLVFFFFNLVRALVSSFKWKPKWQRWCKLQKHVRKRTKVSWHFFTCAPLTTYNYIWSCNWVFTFKRIFSFPNDVVFICISCQWWFCHYYINYVTDIFLSIIYVQILHAYHIMTHYCILFKFTVAFSSYKK